MKLPSQVREKIVEKGAFAATYKAELDRFKDYLGLLKITLDLPCLRRNLPRGRMISVD